MTTTFRGSRSSLLLRRCALSCTNALLSCPPASRCRCNHALRCSYRAVVTGWVRWKPKNVRDKLSAWFFQSDCQCRIRASDPNSESHSNCQVTESSNHRVFERNLHGSIQACIPGAWRGARYARGSEPRGAASDLPGRVRGNVGVGVKLQRASDPGVKTDVDGASVGGKVSGGHRTSSRGRLLEQIALTVGSPQAKLAAQGLLELLEFHPCAC